MQVKEKILVLNRVIKKEFREFNGATNEQKQAELSQELFVLKETRKELMAKIGLKPKEDILHEKEFYL